MTKQRDHSGSSKKALVNRLSRLEGQIRGIQKMILDGKPCGEILIQLNAARRAMQNASIAVLKNYLNQCIADTVSEAPKGKVDELERLIKTLIDLNPIDNGE